jgi:hypothetical protein
VAEDDDEVAAVSGRLPPRLARAVDDADGAAARDSAFSIKSNNLLRHRSSLTAASGAHDTDKEMIATFFKEMRHEWHAK